MATNMADEVSADELYTPSRWSTRLSADVIVDKHMEIVYKATCRARELLECELNVQYDPESGQLLDVYYPSPKQGSSDVVIFIHGGYWQAVSKDDSGFMAPLLATHGITTVALGYDLAPKANMTTIVDQCRKGCAFIRNRFKDSKIYVIGNSAGAHLSACMMTTDWSGYGVSMAQPLAGAVLFSGIYDLKPIQSTHVNEPLNLTQLEIESYSPQYHVGKVPREMKILMAHGDEDSPAFKSQGNDYHKCLLEAGIDSALHVVKDDHFSIMERFAKEDPTDAFQQVLVDFLRST